MGSGDGDSDEAPEHTVYLDAYWIYKFEVTNAQYRQCIEAGACSLNLINFPEDNYPATFKMNWDDADNYCNWAGGRLPDRGGMGKSCPGGG